MREAGWGEILGFIFQPVNFERPIAQVRGGGEEAVHFSPRMLTEDMPPLQALPLPTHHPSPLSTTPGDSSGNIAEKVQKPNLGV